MTNKKAITTLRLLHDDSHNSPDLWVDDEDREAITHAIRALERIDQLIATLKEKQFLVKDTTGTSVYGKVLTFLETGKDF